MRKLPLLAVAACVAVLVALGVPAVSSASSAHLCPRTQPHCHGVPHGVTPGTTPGPLAGCYGRAGINIAGHTAYDCLYLPADDGALYFGQTKYVWWYYWHPHSGDEVVTEIFYKPDLSSWPGAIPPSNNPLHNYAHVPPAGEYGWRIVTLADGCLVVAPSDTGAPPTTCTPTSEGGAVAGPTRPMTVIEQASITAFWRVVGAAVPDRAW